MKELGKNSIHNSGEKAVETLIRLIESKGHSADRGPRSGRNAGKNPDILFKHKDGREIPLEVKQASSSVAQLRPIAYKVTAVRAMQEGDKNNDWWVLPPHDLIRMALDHPGQHCISSFECMNPGAPNTNWHSWACARDEVVERICAAHDKGKESPFKGLAESFKKDILTLYESHKCKARKSAKPGDGAPQKPDLQSGSGAAEA